MAIRTHRPGVFVDKDGTILREVPFSIDIRDIEFMPGAIEGLREFARAGYAIALVTNQSGVARGLFSEHQLRTYLNQLRVLLSMQGVPIVRALYCPHMPGSANPRYNRACACRKPKPGMILDAAAQLGIHCSGSWMIGDMIDDVEAGINAGCKTALVGNTPNQRTGKHLRADLVTASILDVAQMVLGLRASA
jgi:D-glycero-D-manno-heptose 1,7-bisphosphate phosphatase